MAQLQPTAHPPPAPCTHRLLVERPRRGAVLAALALRLRLALLGSHILPQVLRGHIQQGARPAGDMRMMQRLMRVAGVATKLTRGR